jgi:DNA repair exonuclease SbcCD ATPase subunit
LNISEKNKKIQKNNQYKSLLEKVDLNVANSIKVTSKQSYDSLQKELGEIGSNIDKAKKLLTKLEGLKDVCPTCEQSIDSDFKLGLISQEQDLINKERIKELELSKKINQIKEQNNEFDKKQKIQRDWEELYRSIDPSIPSTPLDGEELSERLGRIRAELLRAKEQVAETARINEERTRRNTRIQVIQEQTDEFVRQLDSHISILSKKTATLSNLEILKKAFSTNGFIAYKIENLVKDLEERTNTYLSELSDGRFTLNFVVANDKLNVEITDNGFIIDIEELSTGELARVNTATLIAIRSLMSSISKTQINVLFLDEVISVLDDEGREKLVEILLQEENLNTYLVSHAWTHPLLSKITVNKIDNISYLEM